MLRHNQNLFVLHLKHAAPLWTPGTSSCHSNDSPFLPLTLPQAKHYTPWRAEKHKSLLTHGIWTINCWAHTGCLHFCKPADQLSLLCKQQHYSNPKQTISKGLAHFSMSWTEQWSAKLKAGMKAVRSHLGCCRGCWRSLARWRYSSLRLCRYLSCSLR